MDTDSILIGIGLVVVLGVGAQLLAGVLRVPSIVLLLPAGFLAGIATDDVHPDRLLGDLFQPLVGVGVGLILFEAGLRLSVDELRGGTRRIVSRLLLTGIVVTWAGVTVAVLALFDVGRGSAVMIGAILIVSGPTVVMPLLDFIRPTGRVRTVLKWEGILIDPIGALIGVVVFHILVQGAGSVGTGEELGEILLSLGRASCSAWPARARSCCCCAARSGWRPARASWPPSWWSSRPWWPPTCSATTPAWSRRP